MTYWFDPMVGGGGGGIIGGIPNQAPAMSSAQINASMGWNPAAQAQTTNLYGPMGFGGQTAMYAGIGAGYGRNTGGFNAKPGDVGTISNPGNFNPEYQPGGSADQRWYLGGSQGPRPSENAPRQYGWDANEGAPSPAAPQVYNRGEFNPQTYGWDHNEGAPVFGGQEDIDWYLGGSQGERPSSLVKPGGIGSDAARVPAAVPQLPRQIPSPVDHPYPLGTPDWYNDMRPGGSVDQSWVQGGSQGSRPSSGQAGRDADIAWYLGGSQGPRPSANTDFSAKSRNEPSFLGQYDWATSFGNRDPGTATALRDAGAGSPRAYDPQLDWLSSGIPQQPSATRDQITQAIADRYSQVGGASPNTFGAPSSGYLGSQGRLNQDPFGGYVNPRDLDAGGSFPADYAPRFNAYGNAFNQ